MTGLGILRSPCVRVAISAMVATAVAPSVSKALNIVAPVAAPPTPPGSPPAPPNWYPYELAAIIGIVAAVTSVALSMTIVPAVAK